MRTDEKDNEPVYHVTALSNLAVAFDKYSRCYDKRMVDQSRFKDRFFVLREDELAIGFDKAQKLVERLAKLGDCPLVLRGRIPSQRLNPNLSTGKGRWFLGTQLSIDSLFLVGQDLELTAISVEEAMARSLRVLDPTLKTYNALQPRTLSVLPVARSCQAACRFCFSESSASAEQVQHKLDFDIVERLCFQAHNAGAERFVITGGGEPGLLPHNELLRLIETGSRWFKKTVLITNGVHLARRPEEDRVARLHAYAQSGLSVLAVSRHHAISEVNTDIMGLNTETERLLQSFAATRDQRPNLSIRLICVLQKDGVEDRASLQAYADWAVSQDISEICFKELYVSTTAESAYHSAPSNQWSLSNQVSLALVLSFFTAHGFSIRERLPWGAPILEGAWNGRPLRVAAYTEPSLFWERSNGIARSWNLMADGTCLVSLEDPTSNLSIELCHQGVTA